MRYLVRVCDRCGAEISRNSGFSVMEAVHFDGVDLCDPCETEFKKFMGMEEKE